MSRCLRATWRSSLLRSASTKSTAAASMSVSPLLVRTARPSRTVAHLATTSAARLGEPIRIVHGDEGLVLRHQHAFARKWATRLHRLRWHGANPPRVRFRTNRNVAGAVQFQRCCVISSLLFFAGAPTRLSTDVPHVTFAEEDVMPRVYFPPFSNWQHTSERE